MINIIMEKKCVLVTDDNAADYFLIQKALQECCPEVRLEWVKDGVELLAHLQKRPHPDVVLLDLNMPRKNGFEALNDIKARPELSHIPIVVLTTSRDEEHILQAYQVGSSGFIRKPASYPDLKKFMSAFARYWFDIVELPPNNRPFVAA